MLTGLWVSECHATAQIGPLCTFLYKPILGETTQVEDCEASICLVFQYERDFQGLCVTCWLSVMSYGYERCVFLYPIWWKYIIDFTAKHSLSTQIVTRPANEANHYVYLQVQVQSDYGIVPLIISPLYFI